MKRASINQDREQVFEDSQKCLKNFEFFWEILRRKLNGSDWFLITFSRHFPLFYTCLPLRVLRMKICLFSWPKTFPALSVTSFIIRSTACEWFGYSVKSNVFYWTIQFSPNKRGGLLRETSQIKWNEHLFVSRLYSEDSNAEKPNLHFLKYLILVAQSWSFASNYFSI